MNYFAYSGAALSCAHVDCTDVTGAAFAVGVTTVEQECSTVPGSILAPGWLLQTAGDGAHCQNDMISGVSGGA